MRLIVSKTFKFDAGHYLPNYDGKCATPHGHTFKLEIGVEGENDSETGMVMDFGYLKSRVNERVVDRLDHKFLNDLEIPDFSPNPTAENLVEWIVGIMRRELWGTGHSLKYVKLWETETSCCEWRDNGEV